MARELLCIILLSFLQCCVYSLPVCVHVFCCVPGNPCDRVHFNSSGSAASSSSSSSSSSLDEDPLPGLNPVTLLQVRQQLPVAQLLFADSAVGYLWRQLAFSWTCCMSTALQL
jgi:hypothetical protein